VNQPIANISIVEHDGHWFVDVSSDHGRLSGDASVAVARNKSVAYAMATAKLRQLANECMRRSRLEA